MDEAVSITVERLKQLEALEASIPSMIEKAIVEYKKSNLKKLHERDKANPAAINLRVKRYVERHREEINKKRREKRQNKIKASGVDNPPENLLLNLTDTINESHDDMKPVKVESIYVRAATTAVSTSDVPDVRKQYKKKQKEITDRDAPPQTVTSIASDRTNDVTVRFDT
jgi:hypothetical protein